MASWLDKDGVTYLWGKFKSYFSTHVQTDVPANAVFTDVKTGQILNSDNFDRPLLMAHTQKNDATPVTSNTVYRNNSIYANPSTGKITATSIGCDDVTNSTNWDGTNSSLKTAIIALNSNLVSFILLRKTNNTIEGSGSAAVEFGAGSFPAKQGYERFIIQAWTSHNSIWIPRSSIYEDGSVAVRCRNDSTSAISNFTLSAIAIYIPEAMISGV